MATVPRLIPTSNLKSRLFRQMMSGDRAPTLMRYDSPFDALMMLTVSPETETVAHYVDDHLALLYDPESNEIVGLQLEAFKKWWLPKYKELRAAWQVGVQVKKAHDLAELLAATEKHEKKMSQKVAELAATYWGG